MMNITARIEKNRIALLRLVFCWLAAAHCFTARGDKPLPRRLARFALSLIGKAEKATGYLLITVYYESQIKARRSAAFERAAMNFVAFHHGAMFGTLTIGDAIKRLKTLQQTLHSLHAIARRLRKNIAAHARVVAMKMMALTAVCGDKISTRLMPAKRDDFMPP